MTQVWYAKDASSCGGIIDVHKWFDCLYQSGPNFDCFVNARKCCLVVDRCFLDEAHSHFKDLGIPIVRGQQYLRGFLGDPVGHATFVERLSGGFLMLVTLWRFLQLSLGQHLLHCLSHSIVSGTICSALCLTVVPCVFY